MKTPLKMGLIIPLILFVVSCQLPKSSETETSAPEDNIIYVVGSPTKVYSDSSSARIVDLGDGSAYRRYGKLVEYSFVNEIVIKKFAELDLDAKLQFGYKDIKYNDSKTYIEIIYNEDIETKEIISYQLRLLDESYFTDPDSRASRYYAKSFSINNLQDIKPIPKTSENPFIQKAINKIGTAEAVYSNDDSINGRIFNYGGSETRIYSNMVAFSSISPKIQKIFDGMEKNAKILQGYRYFNTEVSDSYIYIEVIYIEDLQSNSKTYDLRLLDLDAYRNPSADWCSKSYYFTSLSEI